MMFYFTAFYSYSWFSLILVKKSVIWKSKYTMRYLIWKIWQLLGVVLPLTSLPSFTKTLLTSALSDLTVSLPSYILPLAAHSNQKISLMHYSQISLDLDTLPFTIPEQKQRRRDRTGQKRQRRSMQKGENGDTSVKKMVWEKVWFSCERWKYSSVIFGVAVREVNGMLK